MKIKLREPKKERGLHNERSRRIAWKRAFPFAVNPRGILIHRVRDITTYCWDGVKSHHHVTYWCGNGCCFDLSGPRGPEEVLQASPPKDRLLCVYCEMRATIAKEKSADKLAGRHVHIGKLKAERVCCQAS